MSRATCLHLPSLQALLQALKHFSKHFRPTTYCFEAAGMTTTLYEATSLAAPPDRDRRQLAWHAALWSVVSARWAAAALALFLSGLAAQFNGAPETVWWTLYLACYLT